MRIVVLAAAVLLAGCGKAALSPEEQALQNERDVALVQQANNTPPPLEEITPEPILYPDMERLDLMGSMCSYAPGTSLGARVIAREADAFIKIEGEMQRLAADAGSRELPMRTRTLYSGRTYSLKLDLSGDGEATDSGEVDYEGTITLRDPHGRVVYDGSGLARCTP